MASLKGRFQGYLDRQAANEQAEDDVTIEKMRAKFGDQEAAKLAAELYKHRRTSRSDVFGVFPRWLVLFSAVVLALFETAQTLPQILLAVPRFQAELAKAEQAQSEAAIAKVNEHFAKGYGKYP